MNPHEINRLLDAFSARGMIVHPDSFARPTALRVILKPGAVASEADRDFLRANKAELLAFFRSEYEADIERRPGITIDAEKVFGGWNPPAIPPRSI